jgi:hypothetical protein
LMALYLRWITASSTMLLLSTGARPIIYLIILQSLSYGCLANAPPSYGPQSRFLSPSSGPDGGPGAVSQSQISLIKGAGARRLCSPLPRPHLVCIRHASPERSLRRRNPRTTAAAFSPRHPTSLSGPCRQTSGVLAANGCPGVGACQPGCPPVHFSLVQTVTHGQSQLVRKTHRGNYQERPD